MDFQRCTVIGGSGMLGLALIRQLVQGGRRVRSLDLDPLPQPLCEGLVGDIRDPEAVRRACRGAEVVFQAAAAVWDARTPARVYEEVNVGGNRRVVEACRALGVRRLVYTSTMDVVVEGRRPIVDGDESLPYPRRLPRDPYSRSKILAERLVLAANGPDLVTCALRPVGMYGPGDRYHLGNIVRMARDGLYVRLGNGRARFSHAFCGNVAHAHLLAARRLHPGYPVAGRAYFVGDHLPAGNLFDFMEPYLEALGIPFTRRSIPYPLAYALSALAELFAPRSNFKRFAVVQTCVDHTFVHARAERDFGYRPVFSREEAFRLTLEWLKEQPWARPRGAPARGPAPGAAASG